MAMAPVVDVFFSSSFFSSFFSNVKKKQLFLFCGKRVFFFFQF